MRPMTSLSSWAASPIASYCEPLGTIWPKEIGAVSESPMNPSRPAVGSTRPSALALALVMMKSEFGTPSSAEVASGAITPMWTNPASAAASAAFIVPSLGTRYAKLSLSPSAPGANADPATSPKPTAMLRMSWLWKRLVKIFAAETTEDSIDCQFCADVTELSQMRLISRPCGLPTSVDAGEAPPAAATPDWPGPPSALDVATSWSELVSRYACPRPAPTVSGELKLMCRFSKNGSNMGAPSSATSFYPGQAERLIYERGESAFRLTGWRFPRTLPGRKRGFDRAADQRPLRGRFGRSEADSRPFQPA